MMLFQIAIFSLVVTLVITLMARNFPLYITIPTMTALCYGIAVYGSTLFGYAISQQYVDGQTARVLYSVSNYVLVHFEGDGGPRLIRMDSERDAMETKKTEQDEVAIITFGSKPHRGSEEGEGGGDGGMKIMDNSTVERKKILLKPVD